MAAKKNPWSDDSGSDSEMVIPLDVDSVVPKEKPERKAKGETLPRVEEAEIRLLGDIARCRLARHMCTVLPALSLH